MFKMWGDVILYYISLSKIKYLGKKSKIKKIDLFKNYVI